MRTIEEVFGKAISGESIRELFKRVNKQCYDKVIPYHKTGDSQPIFGDDGHYGLTWYSGDYFLNGRNMEEEKYNILPINQKRKARREYWTYTRITVDCGEYRDCYFYYFPIQHRIELYGTTQGPRRRITRFILFDEQEEKELIQWLEENTTALTVEPGSAYTR